MYYVGLDIHKQYCNSCVMDKEGKIIKQDKIDSHPRVLQSYFKKIHQPVHIAMEACYNWGYFLDVLNGVCQKITLAHPLKVKLIAEARIKTDKIDARVLADLLRTNLLPEAYIPNQTTRRVKSYLRYRTGLTMMSTTIKNKIHALIDQHDFSEKETLRHTTDIFGKAGLQILTSLTLPGHDTAILRSWLDMRQHIHKEILEANAWIRKHVREDELSVLIKTIPGIGDWFAILVRYEIDDITRFLSPKKLVGYTGLAPSTYSSGGKTRHGRITKQGNKWLRWAFVEAAQRAPMTSPYFKKYFNHLKKRIGRDRARIATARKIAEVVFGVMRNKQVYKEFLIGQPPSKGSSRFAA